MIWAAYKGHTEIVKFLLENKADVNAKNNNGWTVLMVAIDKGNTEIIEILKAFGAEK
ncbi:MAG: ankyrin repeat domain-containing protein [Bacteroidia bacterium]|nr:ankyrin repeat domain-containing protein [Bacteroidia bacterium]